MKQKISSVIALVAALYAIIRKASLHKHHSEVRCHSSHAKSHHVGRIFPTPDVRVASVGHAKGCLPIAIVEGHPDPRLPTAQKAARCSDKQSHTECGRIQPINNSGGNDHGIVWKIV